MTFLQLLGKIVFKWVDSSIVKKMRKTIEIKAQLRIQFQFHFSSELWLMRKIDSLVIIRRWHSKKKFTASRSCFEYAWVDCLDAIEQCQWAAIRDPRRITYLWYCLTMQMIQNESIWRDDLISCWRLVSLSLIDKERNSIIRFLREYLCFLYFMFLSQFNLH